MVIYVEDYWNTLVEVHDKQLFHDGYRKTFHKACHSSTCIVTVIEIISVFLYKLIQVQSMYCGIPRSVVLEFVKACTTCQLRRPQRVSAPLKPILALGFMSRLQVFIVRCLLH